MGAVIDLKRKFETEALQGHTSFLSFTKCYSENKSINQPNKQKNRNKNSKKACKTVFE